MRSSRPLRSIALFEGAKGLLVLLAGCGALGLVHHDVQHLAERLVAHAHLNPAARSPRVFLELAAETSDARLRLLAAGAAAYALLRFVEAWGLWQARTWAAWFAAVSGGAYLPIEVVELVRRPGWLPAGILLVNLGIVAAALASLARERRLAPGGAA